jgi:hypothetical protein
MLTLASISYTYTLEWGSLGFLLFVHFTLDNINASRLSLSLVRSGDAAALLISLCHGNSEPDFLQGF